MKPDQARKPFRTLGMRMQSFSQSLMRSYAPAPQQASPSENSSKITPVWQSVSEIPLLWPDDAVSAPSQAAFGDEDVNAAAETPSESMSGMYRPTSSRPPRNPMTPAAPPRTAEEAIQRATAPVPPPAPARSSTPPAAPPRTAEEAIQRATAPVPPAPARSSTPPAAAPRTAEEAIQRAMAPASSRPAEGGKNRIPSDLLNLLALHQEADRKRDQIREEKKTIYNESGAPIQRKRGSASFDYVETSALRQPGDGEPEAPATGQAEEARASQSKSEDGEAEGDDSTLAPAGAGPPVSDAPVSAAIPDDPTISSSELPAVMQRQVEVNAPPAAPPLDAADSVDDAPAMQAAVDETSVVMDAPEGSAATTTPTVQRQLEMADAQTPAAPALPHEVNPTQAMDAPVSEPRETPPEAMTETARDTGAEVSRASEVIQRAEAMPEAVTDAPATPIQEDGEAPDYAAAPEMVSRATTDTSDSPARTVTRSDDAEAVTQQATAMPDNTVPERAQRQVETHAVDVTAVPAAAAVHSPVEMATGDVSAAIEAAEQGESPAVDRPVNDVPAVVQRAQAEAVTPNTVSEPTPAAAPMDVAQRNAAPEADEISAPETAATVGGWHEPTVSETMPRMSDAPVIQREMVDVSAAERGESPADRPANDVPAPVQRAQAEAVTPNAVSETTPMDVAADEMSAPETAATVGGWHEPTVSMSDAPVIQRETGDVSATIEAADRPANDVPAAVQRTRAEAATPNAVSEATPTAVPMDVAQENAAPETAATVGGWHEPTVSETTPRMSDAPVIQRETVDVSAVERDESPADRPANDVPAAAVQRAQLEAVTPNAVSEATPTAAPMDVVPEAVAADEMSAPEATATVGGWHEPTVSETTPSMSDAAVIQRETGDVSAAIEAAEQQDIPSGEPVATVQMARAANVHETEDVSAAIEAAEPIENPTAVTADQAAMTEAEAPFTPRQRADTAQRQVVEADRPTAETEATTDGWQTVPADVSAPDYFDEQPIQRAAPAEDAVVMGDEAAAHETRTLETPSAAVMRQVETVERAAPVMEQETGSVPGDEAASVPTRNIQREVESADPSPAQGEVMEADEAGYENLQAVDLLEALNASGYLPAEPDRVARQAAPEMPRGIESVSDKPRLDEELMRLLQSAPPPPAPPVPSPTSSVPQTIQRTSVPEMNRVQRVEDETENVSADVNIGQLARDVYSLLRQRLRIERERQDRL